MYTSSASCTKAWIELWTELINHENVSIKKVITVALDFTFIIKAMGILSMAIARAIVTRTISFVSLA